MRALFFDELTNLSEFLKFLSCEIHVYIYVLEARVAIKQIEKEAFFPLNLFYIESSLIYIIYFMVLYWLANWFIIVLYKYASLSLMFKKN